MQVRDIDPFQHRNLTWNAITLEESGFQHPERCGRRPRRSNLGVGSVLSFNFTVEALYPCLTLHENTGTTLSMALDGRATSPRRLSNSK